MGSLVQPPPPLRVLRRHPARRTGEGLKHHNIGAMNAATRAVAGETHAVGAMVQEKQYLHAPLEELVSCAVSCTMNCRLGGWRVGVGRLLSWC
jgi:hypothetical protein